MESRVYDDHTEHVHYPVVGKSLKDTYNHIFGGNPLCKVTGQSPGGGCSDAAGATSWRLNTAVIQEGVYNSDGQKIGAPTFACHTRIYTPELQEGQQALPEERAAVDAFLQNVTTHELGHAQACQQLKSSVGRFVEQLPSEIDPALVPALNAAVATVIHDFYERQARTADKLFDKHTGHGGKGYGAQLAKHLEDSKDPLDKSMDILKHKSQKTIKRSGSKKRKSMKKPTFDFEF
jgi:predicted secreted Zn-dependent protease